MNLIHSRVLDLSQLFVGYMVAFEFGTYFLALFLPGLAGGRTE
jgi:hypothetical protein